MTDKHYYVADDEIEKLLGMAKAGFPSHPERELITKPIPETPA
jgi:hypothetical protein